MECSAEGRRGLRGDFVRTQLHDGWMEGKNRPAGGLKGHEDRFANAQVCFNCPPLFIFSLILPISF